MKKNNNDDNEIISFESKKNLEEHLEKKSEDEEESSEDEESSEEEESSEDEEKDIYYAKLTGSKYHFIYAKKILDNGDGTSDVRPRNNHVITIKNELIEYIPEDIYSTSKNPRINQKETSDNFDKFLSKLNLKWNKPNKQNKKRKSTSIKKNTGLKRNRRNELSNDFKYKNEINSLQNDLISVNSELHYLKNKNDELEKTLKIKKSKFNDLINVEKELNKKLKMSLSEMTKNNDLNKNLIKDLENENNLLVKRLESLSNEYHILKRENIKSLSNCNSKIQELKHSNNFYFDHLYSINQLTSRLLNHFNSTNQFDIHMNSNTAQQRTISQN